MDPADTAAVRALKHKKPHNVGELRAMLGLLSYYRQYIKNFSRIASSLYDLLKAPTETAVQPRNKDKWRTKQNNTIPSNTPIDWTSAHQSVLEQLIDCLTTPPVLGFPDFSQPFILHTDASNKGLGAVLYQRQDGKLRVIAYGSRTLTAAEKNYHLHSGKLEFLALKWAVTEKFRDYLYYAPSFTVYSDNNPLTYVLSTAKLNATGCRWVAELADFHFTVKYRPGKENIDADSLSRMPLDMEVFMEECSQEMLYDVIGATTEAVKNQDICSAVWSMGLSSTTTTPTDKSITQLTIDQINADQRKDQIIGVIIHHKLAGQKPTSSQLKGLSPKVTCLLREWDKLHIDETGVLYRETLNRKQLVLPEKHKNKVLQELHNEMGHQGVDRTTSLVRDRFYWPHMQKDIEDYVMRKCVCLKQKKPQHETKAPITNIVTTHPFELVSLDFLHLDKCSGGYEYILIIIDHFTRFAQAYATTSKSGKTAADKLFNDYALRFGFPTRIHHDQGGEFENQLFSQLNKYCGVTGSRTTPYHPQGNGQVERFNRTLLQMLRTLTDKQKSNWKESLNKLIFAYNCTRSEVTGFSPFYLLYGRSPRLPIDALFGLNPKQGDSDRHCYVKKWKQGMEEACEIARDSAQKAASKSKRNYKSNIKIPTLRPGDRVLIRNLTPRGGPGKLRNYWEDIVHTVVRQINEDVPVYELKPEKGPKKSRILHRNLLLPCDSLPADFPVLSHPKRRNVQKREDNKASSEDDSEDEENYYPAPLEPGETYCDQSELTPEVCDPTPENSEHIHQTGNTLPVLEEEPERAGGTQHCSDTEDSISSPPALIDCGEERHQRPQRSHRRPKVFTYDTLGTPACHKIGTHSCSWMSWNMPQLNTVPTYYQLTPYGY
uniref:Gypsy retrotransposon integrase-like protein 1 n=1 Tax=Oryzias latipes TaxID=8090 RepID=A0A3P9MR97_ORYLA